MGKYFKTDKLRKAFSFHSMFLGLSPFDALAMYSLITYADLVEGMQYPDGRHLQHHRGHGGAGGEMGVTLRTGTAVREINVANGAANGVTLETGEFVPADIVVSNADLVYTYKQLIRPEYRRVYTDAKLDRMDYACSGYLLYLGVDKQYDHMRHQALYFSEDYRANLDAIFRTKTIPDDPSFHLNNPTVTDPRLAPPGHSVLYLLAPMPNLQGKNDWDAAIPVVREKLYRQLERIVDPEIRKHVVWEREYRPADWERDINAPYGVAFGSLVARLLPVFLFPAAQQGARHPGPLLRRPGAPIRASGCRWCCFPPGFCRKGWRKIIASECKKSYIMVAMTTAPPRPIATPEDYAECRRVMLRREQELLVREPLPAAAHPARTSKRCTRSCASATTGSTFPSRALHRRSRQSRTGSERTGARFETGTFADTR